MPRKNYWVKDVKTVSTFPPPGTFTKSAAEVAAIMSAKEVSPKGIASGIKMTQYYINRAGKKLKPERKEELKKAIELMPH